MPENDQNLGGNVDVTDLSSISLDDAMDAMDGVSLDEAPGAVSNTEGIENMDINSNVDVNSMGDINSIDDINSVGDINSVDLNSATDINSVGNVDVNSMNLGDTTESQSSSIDESVFLESREDVKVGTNVLKGGDKIGSYLRWFFFSTIVILLGVLAIALLYSFSNYINRAVESESNFDHQEYVNSYKEKLTRVKQTLGTDKKNNYTVPKIGDEKEVFNVNEIINATDIDYIEKKDLLSDYVKNLVNKAQDNAVNLEALKQSIAKQGFLPKEIESLVSEDEAIDTIQRSLNALEVIKFSTATKVFSYMNTALVTISEMVRTSGANVENLKQLLTLISSRGEKDISSYVYMCYLNPFEITADCNTIGDLDLYYKIIKDDSVNVKLFKNAMNAISQILEKEGTSLFSITFNGFNAKDKNITFNIEVYTNQEDERSLMSQGIKNPNIFILTNIINLLKQSSFIIGEEINTKEINVETVELEIGGFTRNVNYSNMDFAVPIQKSTEREIFDYIDLENMKKLVKDRGLQVNKGLEEALENLEDTNINDAENNEENVDEIAEDDIPADEIFEENMNENE